LTKAQLHAQDQSLELPEIHSAVQLLQRGMSISMLPQERLSASLANQVLESRLSFAALLAISHLLLAQCI
jgi:hypothetical protein